MGSSCAQVLLCRARIVTSKFMETARLATLSIYLSIYLYNIYIYMCVCMYLYGYIYIYIYICISLKYCQYMYVYAYIPHFKYIIYIHETTAYLPGYCCLSNLYVYLSTDLLSFRTPSYLYDIYIYIPVGLYTSRYVNMYKHMHMHTYWL